MEYIQALIDFITGFFGFIYDYFTDYIVDLLTDFTAWLMIKLTVLYIEGKILMIKFAWGVAESVFTQLNIGGIIASAAGGVAGGAGYAAAALGVFDAINMVIQAMLSSFILKMMRF